MNWAADYLVKRALEMAPLGSQHGGAGAALNIGTPQRSQLASTGVTPQSITSSQHGPMAAGLTVQKPPDPWAGFSDEVKNFGINAGSQLLMNHAFNRMSGGTPAASGLKRR